MKSLKPKIDVIEGILNNIDILCFTESWLNKDIKDKEIELKGFHPPFRNDRTYKPGGGVCVYIKNTYVCKRRPDLEIHGIELVWVDISIKHESFLIGTFCRPLTLQILSGTLLRSHSILQTILT